MRLRASNWARFVIPFTFVFLAADRAHAQRVPDIVVWCAGASLFAPFVAVPVKIGLLRLLRLELSGSRLWIISAIEWALWFPAAFLLLRSGNQSSVPLIVVFLFASAVWVHKARVSNAPWSSALFLALPTPLLALLLPFLAFGSAAFLDSLVA
jgi:hypothetical protein